MEGTEIACLVCLVAAILVVGWRFYLRVIKEKRHDVQEYTLVFCIIMFFVLAMLQHQMFDLLTVMPTATTPDAAIQLQKLFFIGTFFYYAIWWSTKIAIVLLHLQLTKKFETIHKCAVWLFYAILATYPLIHILLFASCLPVPRRWAVDETACPPLTKDWQFWISWFIHIALELCLFVMPFPALLKITEARLRLAVCAVYGLAFVTIVVGVVRFTLLATDAQPSIPRIFLLSTIELSVLIIVATLPGISSSFIRKYGQTSDSKSKSRGRIRTGYGTGTGITRTIETRIEEEVALPSLKPNASRDCEVLDKKSDFYASTDDIVAGGVSTRRESS